MLEKKYLPDPLVCVLTLVKFNNELEFKEGLRDSLWNCDKCSYNIDIENIKGKYNGILSDEELLNEYRNDQ